MAKSKEKKDEKEFEFNMRNYDYIGLVEQLKKEEGSDLYILGAMDVYGDVIPEQELRDGYKAQLRVKSTEAMSGLELAVSIYGKKRQEARGKTSLAEFCELYSPSDFIKDSLKDFYKETIGDIEEKVRDWSYKLKDPKENFSKKEKEEAQKGIEKYSPVLAKIKLVEDRVFAQLKILAIDRTEKIIAEEAEKEKKSE